MAQATLVAAREDWLALTAEDALEPEIPIIDTHHHLWEHGPGGRYLLAEMAKDTGSGHRVVSTVYVDNLECVPRYRKDGPEALKPVGETEFVEEIAREAASGRHGPTRVAAAIVGKADLTLGAGVARVLEAHLEASPTRFRAIRHWLNWDPYGPSVGLRSDAPRGLAGERAFREGYARLADYRLVFDAWIFFHQLPELAGLARAFPGIPIVVNHAGGLLGLGPYAKRDEVYREWKCNVSELSHCENVFMKLGGLCVPRTGFGWHLRDKPPSSTELVEALGSYILHTIDAFGPTRCMFESNFPADKAACSYSVLWNCFKRLTRKFAPAERSALFHDTAARVYRV